MYRKSAHPYQVRFGFRKATPNVSHLQTITNVAHNKAVAFALAWGRALARFSLAFFALFVSQGAASTSLFPRLQERPVCRQLLEGERVRVRGRVHQEPADGRVPSLDATDISPEQCRQQCEFAHELVAHEAWV